MISIEAYRAVIGIFIFITPIRAKTFLHGMTRSKFNRNRILRLFQQSSALYVMFVFITVSLLIAGDIESNPGPYTLNKVIEGGFHQGDKRFGNTAGSQCMCNALWSICYSQLKCVRYWKEWDINRILELGNDLYVTLGYTDQHLSLSDLPPSINSNSKVIDIQRNDSRLVEMSVDSVNFLPVDENFSGAIIVAGGFGTSFISHNGIAYVFDSHSGDKQGLPSPSGTAVFLKFPSFNDAEKYVKHLYLSYFRNETIYFEMQSYNINISLDTKIILKGIFQREKNSSSDRKRRLSSNVQERECVNKARRRLEFSNEEKATCRESSRQRMANLRENLSNERRDNLRKSDRQRKAAARKNLSDEQRNHLRESSRLGMATRKENLSDEQRKIYKQVNLISQIKRQKKLKSVTGFKNIIKKGPYYVCVVCNRNLYQTSVLLFREDKYEVSGHIFQSRVFSINNKEYICKTCDSKLLRNKIPSQAVCNDLKVVKMPERFFNIRKLEKVLISKRLLFKKIAIMPKGQSPKMRGTICNVPIRADDVCNILPRGMDNNGIVQVALKKRMRFKSNVYFEAVRPEFIREILLYLKENNTLYSDIEINVENIPENWVSTINNNDDNVDIDFINESSVPKVKAENENEEENNPLDDFRLGTSETAYVPELAYEITDDSKVTIAPGEDRQPLAIICDDNCELLAHPYLFPNGKFGYLYEREVPLSPCKYFNQRLLNHTQVFASDADYIFFAHSVTQHLNLNSCINIAMKKIKADGLTAGELSQNFKEKISTLIANDEAFNFMNTLKGTPAYWKRFLLEVLAMVKQLGLPTYFMTLSCADLRWNELIEIISKLNKFDMSVEEIENLDYFERTKILNSNPVFLSRHFQYRVENFFKHIVLNGSLGKVIHYAIRVEFQVRGSPHIHSLLWVENAPILSEYTKNEYVDFVDNVIKCNLPNTDNSNLFKLVKTYQTHNHSKSCRKYKNVDCRYSFGKFFCDRTIIAEPLSDDFSSDQKNTILAFKKIILNNVKKYIDDNLNPKYKNIHDPFRNDYQQPKTISQILEELEIDEEEYYGCLSTSSDSSFQIHFKRSPESCFTNNFFEDGILAWEANIDIQPVLDYYKAVAYMCAYLSKSEDESSEAMKQAASEAFEFGKTAYEKTKSVAKAYRTHREMSIQEAVSIILPEIWLRKTSPAVMFANSNLPEKRYRVCRSEEEIANMHEDETNIFKKNMLDRYIDRPNMQYRKGKYACMENICYAEFLENYVIDTKKRIEEENDCQPTVLEDLIISEEPSTLPKSVPLMSCKEYVKLRKTKCVLRYHVPNKITKPEAYAHHLLFMFYPFREESSLNQTPSGTYSEKLFRPDVIQVVNRNKSKCEPFSETVDEAFAHFNENRARGLDSLGEQENDEVRENIAAEETENFETNNDETFTSGSLAQTTVVSDIKLNENIRSLNSKQREIFQFISKWTRKTIQSMRTERTSKPESFYIFLTGGAGTGKSHTLTTIKQYLKKALSYGSGNCVKERILMLAPTGVAAVHVDGSTIHSALGIISDRSNAKVVSKLNDKKRSSLRQRFSELKVIIIDEISMVSNKLLLHIHQRLCEIFGCTTDNPFAGISIITCGDFYQLPPIQQKPVYANFNDSMLNILHCWRNFKIAELTEVMRQRGDQVFIDLLNNIRIGVLTEQDQETLMSRFIEKTDPNYPTEAIHIWAENALVNEHNKRKLQELPGNSYEVLAIDKLPDNITDAVLEKVYERNQMDTGGLAHKLEIKLKCKVMLTANIDVDDKLCNGQIGMVEHFKFDSNENIIVIYLRMDEDVGLKAINSDNFGRQQNLVKVERIEKEIKLKKNSPSSPTIKRLQFPLILSWACTVHKVQGKTFPEIVFSFDLLRQRRFNNGQVYVALSRVTSLAGLY